MVEPGERNVGRAGKDADKTPRETELNRTHSQHCTCQFSQLKVTGSRKEVWDLMSLGIDLRETAYPGLVVSANI